MPVPVGVLYCAIALRLLHPLKVLSQARRWGYISKLYRYISVATSIDGTLSSESACKSIQTSSAEPVKLKPWHKHIICRYPRHAHTAHTYSVYRYTGIVLRYSEFVISADNTEPGSEALKVLPNVIPSLESCGVGRVITVWSTTNH